METLALRYQRVFALAAFPIYLLITRRMIGLRVEHLVIAAAFLALFMIGPKTARFAVLAMPFLLVGVLYDNLRLVLDLRGPIHVADLYSAERAFFGVHGQTPNEVFRAHPIIALDVICGLAYFGYLLESIGFGVYLFFKDQALLTRFAWAFLIANVLGMITYLIYPAAPPWYVDQYGLGEAITNAVPSAAGAARFDALLGFNYFQHFYARNPNVFGAMPSLHVAYPTIVLLFSLKLGKRFFIPAAAFMLLMAFSAVYLGHHYVLDVIVGAIFGLLGFLAVSGTEALERWSPAIFWTACSALFLALAREEPMRIVVIPLAGIALAAGFGVYRRRASHFESLSITKTTGAKIAADASTVLGAGLTPKGSGTVGAIAALPLAFALAMLDPLWRIPALIAITALSVFAVDRYLRYERRSHDPHEVVVDELVGVSIAIAFVPWTLGQVAAAFVLFRILDIFKPGPIRWLERRLPGAWGVVFDDVAAGLLAGLILLLLRKTW